MKKYKIKILYVVSTLKRCGPSNQLFNIVSNLDPTIFDSKVLTLSKETNDTLKPKFQQAGIEVASLELGRLYGAIVGFGKLKKLIDDFKPSIIHTQGIRADYFAGKLKRRGVKTVATIRCIPYEDYLMKYGDFIGKRMAVSHIKYLKRIDLVAAVSKTISSKLRDVGLETVVVQNGCDTVRYHPVPSVDKKALRRKLNLPLYMTVLISVGHLSKLKDPITIIKALGKCTIKSKYFLIFVGDGDLRKECESMIIDSEVNVRFTGRVSNVDEYLKASDVFISASTSEGLPNTVLESLACGVPTILSKIPQHEEIFSDSIVKPLFFNLQDSNNLANILEGDLINHLATLPSRKIIENHFDSVNMSKHYQRYYRQLV